MTKIVSKKPKQYYYKNVSKLTITKIAHVLMKLYIRKL